MTTNTSSFRDLVNPEGPPTKGQAFGLMCQFGRGAGFGGFVPGWSKPPEGVSASQHAANLLHAAGATKQMASAAIGLLKAGEAKDLAIEVLFGRKPIPTGLDLRVPVGERKTSTKTRKTRKPRTKTKTRHKTPAKAPKKPETLQIKVGELERLLEAAAKAGAAAALAGKGS